jgi:hypothetical protein
MRSHPEQNDGGRFEIPGQLELKARLMERLGPGWAIAADLADGWGAYLLRTPGGCTLRLDLGHCAFGASITPWVCLDGRRVQVWCKPQEGIEHLAGMILAERYELEESCRLAAEYEAHELRMRNTKGGLFVPLTFTRPALGVSA